MKVRTMMLWLEIRISLFVGMMIVMVMITMMMMHHHGNHHYNDTIRELDETST